MGGRERKGSKGDGKGERKEGGVVVPHPHPPYSKPCIGLPLNEVRNGSNSGDSAFFTTTTVGYSSHSSDNKWHG